MRRTSVLVVMALLCLIVAGCAEQVTKPQDADPSTKGKAAGENSAGDEKR